MKRLLPLLLLLAGFAHAETQYISDSLTTTLRANPVGDAKVVGNPLSAGNPVELLQRSPDGRWARVRFQQYEGWLPATQLQREPGARDRLQEMQARVDAMTREHRAAIEQAQKLEADSQDLRAALARAQEDRDNALRQFGDLKIDSAGPQQLARRNNQLQQEVTALTVDNERLQAEVDRLGADQRTRFFFYGGLLVLLALFMGWLLARQSGRRAGW